MKKEINKLENLLQDNTNKFQKLYAFTQKVGSKTVVHAHIDKYLPGTWERIIDDEIERIFSLPEAEQDDVITQTEQELANEKGFARHAFGLDPND